MKEKQIKMTRLKILPISLAEMWRKQAPLYFAYRNEVYNGCYEGLIGRVYQKLKCTHFLIYL